MILFLAPLAVFTKSCLNDISVVCEYFITFEKKSILKKNNIIDKQDALMKKIDKLQEEYDDIGEELDRTATKSNKIRNTKSNKLKNKKDDEGCCIC